MSTPNPRITSAINRPSLVPADQHVHPSAVAGPRRSPTASVHSAGISGRRSCQKAKTAGPP